MPHPFPSLNEQKQPHAWAIAPNASALKSLAEGIWDCAVQTNQRSLVVLSTAGPLMGVRAALEKYRPKDLPSHIAFLPQVMSFNDWLEAAPGAWKFPKKQSDLERWLSVYINLRKHKTLQSWFKAESEAGAWGLAQAVIDACDSLSEAVIPLMQGELNDLVQNQTLDAELWVKKVGTLLDQAIAKAYVGLSRQVVDQESTVLLAFWRYLSSPGDPVMRKHIALAAHLQTANVNQAVARPLIWVETADPKPIDQEVMFQYLQAYSQFAPVVNITMDWHSVALWSEALTGQDVEGQLKPANDEQEILIKRNIQNSFHDGWRLLAARRFEELAWAAAKSIEAHLIAGKTNIALVAQDRLAARRARALLSRFGPSLRIRDETGWKLSTTRAAASINSWLELIRSPKEGPSASFLLEFLQNPFFDIAHFLQKPPQACVSLIAQLEDILIASQAKSGWETFRIAIERANAYSSTRGSVPHASLLELLTLLQRYHAQWLELKLDCVNAYALLQANLQEMGMAQQLEKDSAGKQLLEVLKTFDLGAGDYRQVAMRLPEWLSLLKTIIEEASYQEVGQQAEATLSILPLSSTRLREFDAVVIVGCDEQQLPAFSEPPLFFSDTLNRLLKASTITAQYIQQARDLSQLLISCPQVDLLWQSKSKSKSGEPLRPSAWISRLRTQLPDWPILEAKPDMHADHSDPLQEAVTTVNQDIALPISMSPSAYKALRDCPYRYYVRSILGLRKAKEFEEGFDASLAGQVLHALLKNFFQALKTEEQKSHSTIHEGEDARRAWMEEHLTKHSEIEFERLIKGDARVTGTLRDWQKQIPSFVDWQLKREAEGWRYHDAELPVGFMVMLTDSNGVQREIKIAGRADRFDVNANHSNAAAVIDYKNQGIAKIKKRAEHLLDDPQLLIYARAVNENALAAHLPGRTIERAEWVSLKAELKKADDKIVRAHPVEQMPEMMQQFSEQLNEDLEVLWARKPMKAFAPDSVCQYCEARGICRKGMW